MRMICRIQATWYGQLALNYHVLVSHSVMTRFSFKIELWIMLICLATMDRFQARWQIQL
mgnify:CR=1 FL=1